MITYNLPSNSRVFVTPPEEESAFPLIVTCLLSDETTALALYGHKQSEACCGVESCFEQSQLSTCTGNVVVQLTSLPQRFS
jgi:hypothetical protein